MEEALSLVLGYGLGCINNAALFSKIKRKNLRKEGTGNIGATNAVMVLGRTLGVMVMLLDILKGAIAYKLAETIFKDKIFGLYAGLGAMLGHIFPFYMKFRGGKGLAAFGGAVLAHNPLMFGILLASVFVLLFIANHSFIVPFAGTVIFAIMATFNAESNMLEVGIVTALMAAVVIYKHIPNLKKTIIGDDIGVRDYIRKYIFKQNDNEAL